MIGNSTNQQQEVVRGRLPLFRSWESGLFSWCPLPRMRRKAWLFLSGFLSLLQQEKEVTMKRLSIDLNSEKTKSVLAMIRPYHVNMRQFTSRTFESSRLLNVDCLGPPCTSVSCCFVEYPYVHVLWECSSVKSTTLSWRSVPGPGFLCPQQSQRVTEMRFRGVRRHLG